jgi:hypothetical protein
MLLTKPQMADRLRSLASAAVGTVHPVGGDCYALCVGQEIRVVVALKESVKQGKSLWIGLPTPVIELVVGGRTLLSMPEPHPYRGWILMSHVRFKTLVAIPVVPVAQDLSRRASADRVTTRDEFDVKMVGYKKYVIQGESMSGDIPIKHVDTFLPIETFLHLARADFEGTE